MIIKVLYSASDISKRLLENQRGSTEKGCTLNCFWDIHWNYLLAFFDNIMLYSGDSTDFLSKSFV